MTTIPSIADPNHDYLVTFYIKQQQQQNCKNDFGDREEDKSKDKNLVVDY